ncbi:hypothetical protein D3C85_1619410 [compost metagenome]
MAAMGRHGLIAALGNHLPKVDQFNALTPEPGHFTFQYFKGLWIRVTDQYGGSLFARQLDAKPQLPGNRLGCAYIIEEYIARNMRQVD